MKKIAVILLFTFSFFCSFAQDTIFKRNNDIVVAKISEITTTEIKYKKFNFQDGPLYIDRKSDIRIIIYSSGMRETFEEEKQKPAANLFPSNSNNKIEDLELRYRFHNVYINQQQMQKTLLDTKDKKIMGLVAQAKEARKMEFIGLVAIPLGTAAYLNFFELNSPTYSNGDQRIVLVVSGVFALAAISCPIISSIKKKQKVRFNSEAINLYNQKF